MLAEIDILQQILKGGVIAMAIVALSIVLLTLAIVHLLTLRRATQCPEELLETVEEQVGQRQFDTALELVESDPSALAEVLEAVLRAWRRTLGAENPGWKTVPHDGATERLREALSEGAAEQSLRLTQRISWVALVAAVAPMMGLLGTVSGMVRAFAAMSASAGPPEPSVLAGAISEALITTYLGLTVAIPALVLHAILRHRVLNLVLRINDMGENFLAALIASCRPGGPQRPSSRLPRGQGGGLMK